MALRQSASLSKQKTVIIIGAGVSGLACARQIRGLINQFQDRWMKTRKERTPRVIILEGRGRIGGRVYSHPLRNQKDSLPNGLANTAELGAQIITGFEHGNPLNAIVRGQLALRYHSMRDNMVLYDFDGTLVDEKRDSRIQTMFNDMLETVSVHRWQPVLKPTTNMSGILMETSKGPLSNGNLFVLPVTPKSEDDKVRKDSTDSSRESLVVWLRYVKYTTNISTALGRSGWFTVSYFGSIDGPSCQRISNDTGAYLSRSSLGQLALRQYGVRKRGQR